MSNNPTCAVCLEGLIGAPGGATSLDCGHVFHTACVTAWINAHSDCPVCRRPAYKSQFLTLQLKASTTGSSLDGRVRDLQRELAETQARQVAEAKHADEAERMLEDKKKAFARIRSETTQENARFAQLLQSMQGSVNPRASGLNPLTTPAFPTRAGGSATAGGKPMSGAGQGTTLPPAGSRGSSRAFAPASAAVVSADRPNVMGGAATAGTATAVKRPAAAASGSRSTGVAANAYGVERSPASGTVTECSGSFNISGFVSVGHFPVAPGSSDPRGMGQPPPKIPRTTLTTGETYQDIEMNFSFHVYQPSVPPIIVPAIPAPVAHHGTAFQQEQPLNLITASGNGRVAGNGTQSSQIPRMTVGMPGRAGPSGMTGRYAPGSDVRVGSSALPGPSGMTGRYAPGSDVRVGSSALPGPSGMTGRYAPGSNVRVGSSAPPGSSVEPSGQPHRPN